MYLACASRSTPPGPFRATPLTEGGCTRIYQPPPRDDLNEKDPDFWCRESHLTNGIAKYGAEGDTWQRRCELYLLDCGVTQEEIVRLREILLEPAK